MKRNFFILWMGVGAVLLATQTLQATPANNCGDHGAIVDRLATQYGERRRGVGLSGGTSLLEIFASDETGSWSITVTAAGGPTCLVAAGDYFQALDDALPINDEGT